MTYINSSQFHWVRSEHPTADPDEILVRAAQMGSCTAFSELYALYERRIFRTVRSITQNRQDAEDATQDAFLSAFKAISRFEWRSHFSSWLKRIAINSALMVLRKRRRCPELPLDLSHEAWGRVIETGIFGEPFPKSARIGRVDYRDVAETVGIAFAEDRLVYGTFELCAGLTNREEVVAVMSSILRRQIRAAEPSFEAWAAIAGIPPEEGPRQGLKKIFSYYADSPLGGNSLALRSILRREPTSLRQYIMSLMAK